MKKLLVVVGIIVLLILAVFLALGNVFKEPTTTEIELSDGTTIEVQKITGKLILCAEAEGKLQISHQWKYIEGQGSHVEMIIKNIGTQMLTGTKDSYFVVELFAKDDSGKIIWGSSFDSSKRILPETVFRIGFPNEMFSGYTSTDIDILQRGEEVTRLIRFPIADPGAKYYEIRVNYIS